MPRIKLTKSTIDSLSPSAVDVVYWDKSSPGFGIKVTPKGRKVFIVLYRTGGAGSRLRKYTIGPYGRVTLHQARAAAQKVFAAKFEGRDPATEKRAAKRRIIADRVEDLLEIFIAQHVSARPKQFRERLEKIVKALSQAEEVCRLNDTVGSLERHLLHWAMETQAQGAAMLPGNLDALERQMQTVRETVVALQQCLPPDPGRQRPFDDERKIMFLADIFEEAGGKAIAYASEHVEIGSMADTPFRSFAQQFYSLLPSDDKRDRGGLDDALRDALATRRRQRSATS